MVYPLSKLTIIPILLSRVKEIRGLENLPANPPYILAINHLSYIDSIIISALIAKYRDQKTSFLTQDKDKFYRLFGKKISGGWASCIPISNKEYALKEASRRLKSKGIVGIHPEGHRSHNSKQMLEGRTGMTRLALWNKSDIIPIGIQGTEKIMPPPDAKIKSLKKTIIIAIGRPISLKQHYNKKITRKLLRTLTDQIMEKIAKLSHQKYKT